MAYAWKVVEGPAAAPAANYSFFGEWASKIDPIDLDPGHITRVVCNLVHRSIGP